MDEGTLIMSGLASDRIIDAVNLIASQQLETRAIPIVPDYPKPAVSKQVARIVLSYTDYINRTVWHK
jgi:UDP-N-acetylglucosamine 2-epimerase (non-hydrolysing)